MVEVTIIVCEGEYCLLSEGELGVALAVYVCVWCLCMYVSVYTCTSATLKNREAIYL